MSNALTACIACGALEVRIIMELPAVPVHCNVLWHDRASALSAPRGSMTLAYCSSCGHVFNAAFDPRLMEYTQAYENSLHFSPRFQEYATALARKLVESHEIRHKTVIDVGCGKGDFLALLCEIGNNRGYGFDPSFEPELMDKPGSERMTIIRDFYSPAYSQYQGDLITCRHVLEHIANPITFLADIRNAVGDRNDTVVFFEVPNAHYTLDQMGIWDLIYEHVSYFTAPSLATIFARNGFGAGSVDVLFDGQFLGITVRLGKLPGSAPHPQVRSTTTLVEGFAQNYREKVALWQKAFKGWTRDRKRVVIWGGGSKGVTLLNVLANDHTVRHVVDINPRKQGSFVSGVGAEVVGPEALRDIQPHVVVLMNPIYRNEIQQQLVTLGVHAQVELA